jgi:hypothetical protein
MASSVNKANQALQWKRTTDAKAQRALNRTRRTNAHTRHTDLDNSNATPEEHEYFRTTLLPALANEFADLPTIAQEIANLTWDSRKDNTCPGTALNKLIEEIATATKWQQNTTPSQHIDLTTPPQSKRAQYVDLTTPPQAAAAGSLSCNAANNDSRQSKRDEVSHPVTPDHHEPDVRTLREEILVSELTKIGIHHAHHDGIVRQYITNRLSFGEEDDLHDEVDDTH